MRKKKGNNLSLAELDDYFYSGIMSQTMSKEIKRLASSRPVRHRGCRESWADDLTYSHHWSDYLPLRGDRTRDEADSPSYWPWRHYVEPRDEDGDYSTGDFADWRTRRVTSERHSPCESFQRSRALQIPDVYEDSWDVEFPSASSSGGILAPAVSSFGPSGNRAAPEIWHDRQGFGNDGLATSGGASTLQSKGTQPAARPAAQSLAYSRKTILEPVEEKAGMWQRKQAAHTEKSKHMEDDGAFTSGVELKTNISLQNAPVTVVNLVANETQCVSDVPAAVRSSEVKLLYVDALNQMQCFKKDLEFWDGLSRLQQFVRTFVKAAKASGFHVKVFLDGTYRFGEALDKWKSRRLREVSNGERNVPNGYVTLVADAFKACGVEVHFSWSHDNDTTTAAWAVLDGADILSKDKDFFRYEGTSFRVYKQYTISPGQPRRLLLQEKEYPLNPSSRMTIPSLRPQTHFNQPFIYNDPSIHPTAYIYMRGVPSALVRSHGNLYVAARPLRQALYAKLGIGSDPVLEIFPVWDESRQEACFTQELVYASSRRSHLLRSPWRAVDKIFPPHLRIMPANVDFVTWSNHVFAMFSIVFEICLESGECRPGSLLQMLQARERSLQR